MTTEVENGIEIFEKYQQLGVFLPPAMPAIDVMDALQGIWPPSCPLWPYRRRAFYQLGEILAAFLDTNSTNSRSIYLLELEKKARNERREAPRRER